MKKALVTGGCGGIGEAICKKLSDAGYFVYINYAHSKDRSTSTDTLSCTISVNGTTKFSG